MDVFILLVYLIQLKVSSANLLDLLDHMLLDRIVVEKNFCDGLIDFEGVFEVFAYFSSEEIVAEAQTLEGCEWTLYHVIEFLGNVLRLNLAFGEIELFDGEGFLVFQERSSDLDDTLFDWVALKDERLQKPVASETLSDHSTSLFIHIAIAEVQSFLHLVAVEEFLHHPEHF